MSWQEGTKGTLSKQKNERWPLPEATHRATGSDRHSIDHELVLAAGWLIGERPLAEQPSSAENKEGEEELNTAQHAGGRFPWSVWLLWPKPAGL